MATLAHMLVRSPLCACCPKAASRLVLAPPDGTRNVVGWPRCADCVDDLDLPDGVVPTRVVVRTGELISLHPYVLPERTVEPVG